MNERKIRVAITQGDANGVGFEIIFKAFMESEMLSLCTPIIYGSPKVASYHGKVLNIHCPYSIINNVEDVKDERVNFLVSYADDMRVEFGRETDSSALLAVRAMEAAVSDCKKGAVDVIVGGPINNRSVNIDDREGLLADMLYNIIDPQTAPLRIYESDSMRMAVANTGRIRDIAKSLTKENISAHILSLHTALRRDFRIDNPRIAVLALNIEAGSEEQEVLAPAVSEMVEKNVQVFGPYRSDEFFAERKYEAFDVTLALYAEQAFMPMRMLSDSEMIVLRSNAPIVCTIPCCDAQMSIAGRGKADPALLRKALYRGIDLFRARCDYDEALANPLPKLYKESSDSSERPYFPPIPKRESSEPKIEQSDGQQ